MISNLEYGINRMAASLIPDQDSRTIHKLHVSQGLSILLLTKIHSPEEIPCNVTMHHLVQEKTLP